jgi:predicted amidohydrolase
MKLAAVQYSPPKGQPERARAELVGWGEAAGRAGAGLIVFPEMATTGYIWEDADELRPHAEPALGPTFAALSAVARRHGAWVVCGYAEASGPHLHNSALVINHRGELVSSYRKVLLFDADLSWARPGRARAVLPTPFGPLAPAICMDLNDDGLIAFLHRGPARVLAFCTNWLEEGGDVHPYWVRRLAGWPGVVVAANRWGEDRGVPFCGQSAIIGADGAVLAAAGREGDGLLLAEVPLPATDPAG